MGRGSIAVGRGSVAVGRGSVAVGRGSVAVGRGSVAVRTSGSQLREPEFKSSCCTFEALAILSIPHCHSSLGCINEYLATGRGVYLNKLSLRSNCSMAECFPENLRWRWNEQVCQE